MKKVFLFSIIALFFSITIGCEKCDEKDNPKKKIVNKEFLGVWKCAGFGNTETGKIRPIKPQNCEKCFTLNFKNDGSFIIYSTFELENSGYIVIGNTLIITFLYTYIGEEGDGNDFREILANTQHPYKIENNQLFIYYSNTEYLLFNRKK